MKKILMAAALGMLLSAVCMAQNATVRPGDGQLAVTWDAVEGASTYRLFYGTNPEDPDQRFGDIPGTRAVISSLENGVQYYVSVYPMDEAGGAIAELKGDGTPRSPDDGKGKQEAKITSVKIDSPQSLEEIVFIEDPNNNTFTGTVPKGTKLNSMTLAITFEGKSVTSIGNGTERKVSPGTFSGDFTKPVAYEVSPKDGGNSKLYKVVVEFEGTKKSNSTQKEGEPPSWVESPDELKDYLKTVLGDDITLADVFVGIGSGKIKNKSDYQAIQLAEARARQDIAFQRDAYINALIRDYTKNVEAVKGKDDDSVTKSSLAEDFIVGEQTVDTSLRPVKVVTRKRVGEDWWVVVTTLKPGTPAAQVSVKTTEGASIYEEGLKEAVKLMDERLERNKLKPTVSPAVHSEPTAEPVIE